MALICFNISSGSGEADLGPWLLLALIVCTAWGVQAYFMRKASTVGVTDGTTFGYMALSGLLLVPVALMMMGGLPDGAPWQAPALTAGTQLLNAVGALFLVMALSRGSLDRRANHQRPRARADHCSLARRLPDPAVRLQRRRDGAGHRRLHPYGLRRRKTRRGHSQRWKRPQAKSGTNLQPAL